MAVDKLETQTEEERFYAMAQAAWVEIDAYGKLEYDESADDAADPAYRHATAFFDIYLARRPEEVAVHALTQAIAVWTLLLGGSRQIEAALQRVGDDEAALSRVIPGVWDSFVQDNRQGEADTIVESLLNRIHSPWLFADALLSLTRNWMYSGDTARARAACERIVAANASEWHVKQARSTLHELSDLNVGQMAPVFSRVDIDGQPFDLAAMRGKTVLIDFWATWCGPCRGEFPHLRRINDRFKDKDFVMLSISLDDDCAAARKMIAKDKLTWRNICEGGWDSALASEYNVLGIPRTILIGPDGRIVAKGLRDVDLDPAIARLVEPGEQSELVE